MLIGHRDALASLVFTIHGEKKKKRKKLLATDEDDDLSHKLFINYQNIESLIQ